MKTAGILMFLFATLCCAQDAALSNLPRPMSGEPNIRAWIARAELQLRVKAPDAPKVRVNFWSGPKADMEKQPDGFWTITTPPLVPGLALLHADH